MSLNTRQTKLYTDTVDLYAPNTISIGTNRKTTEPGYPSTPTHSSVACYRESKKEALKASPIGRTDTDNIFTIDVFHFDASQAIGANWFIQVKTSGDPDENIWFKVQGDPQIVNFRANKLKINAVRSLTRPTAAF
ncbi:MAG TPA: hypothetical protein VJQ25_03950 [Nitrospira sp.]|nr:hypothetical protein [Nitrospira sp.]